ncbi:MAG: type II toxin-antitoxin system RelE/ParE family toxin [Deltaproteobacteria bacterium]|nr:type II toxin-antitoxin system RelE/ParE family toxin [Deltaproteobacteria bacterium]
MIKSFCCKETQKLFNRQLSKKMPSSIQKNAIKKLWILHAATQINDLRVPPSNHLEALKGNRKGQHSIRINQQWRICFNWHKGNAFEVEIVNYH